MMKTLSRLGAALLALFAWIGLGAIPALAQKNDIGGDFLIGLPQNEFRTSVNEVGYGIGGHYGRFLGNAPLMIGFDIEYLNYGTERRDESFSETIPEVTVKIETTNNILMLHGFARVQPQKGFVRPYFEGLYGFKFLFTRTSIHEGWDNDTIASSTNFDDLAGSWGLGAGTDFTIWEGHRKTPGKGILDISLNFSARYLWGSEADYLKRGSIISNPDGTVTYLVLRSRTDVFVPRFGIQVRF
jgi:hypothetical protein